jgi:hypothetical protein
MTSCAPGQFSGKMPPRRSPTNAAARIGKSLAAHATFCLLWRVSRRLGSVARCRHASAMPQLVRGAFRTRHRELDRLLTPWSNTSLSPTGQRFGPVSRPRQNEVLKGFRQMDTGSSRRRRNACRVSFTRPSDRPTPCCEARPRLAQKPGNRSHGTFASPCREQAHRDRP